MRRWWSGEPDEIYWLEITDREDLGADLNAPQARQDGGEFCGYSSLREVEIGDVVFHYHQDRRAVLALGLSHRERCADLQVCRSPLSDDSRVMCGENPSRQLGDLIPKRLLATARELPLETQIRSIFTVLGENG
jgi:hypothetical protein